MDTIVENQKNMKLIIKKQDVKKLLSGSQRGLKVYESVEDE